MKLTREQMETMAVKASFLRERMDGKVQFPQAPDEARTKRRLEQWKKNAGGRGGEKSFLQRLKMDDLSLQQAWALASAGDGTYVGELPPYLDVINDMLAEIPAGKGPSHPETLWLQEDSFIEKQLGQHGKAVPLRAEKELRDTLNAMHPFLRYGEKKLTAMLGPHIHQFTPKALGEISEILATVLLPLVGQVLSQDFRVFVLRKTSMTFLVMMMDEDFMDYYSQYTAHLLHKGWAAIFVEYPLLPRLITIYTDNWLKNMAALGQHMTQDQAAITHAFNEGKSLGTMAEISGNMGDAHHQGKTVLIITFASGLKLVYKPRNLSTDTAFQVLLADLKQKGLPYDLKAPKALNRQDHGWVEFVEHKALDHLAEAKTYYLRMGALLALVYILGGNDFHTENMIACGNQPVLIDLETILSYQVTPYNDQVEALFREADQKNNLAHSVLGLGILPVWFPVSKDHWVDLGALTGTSRQSNPKLGDKAIPVTDYVKELTEGFSDTYDFFMKHRDAFTRSWCRHMFPETPSPIRFVMRATRVYAQTLATLASPRFLKDGFLYSIEVERFAVPYFMGVSEEKSRQLWPVFRSERNNLEERDIPLFFGDAIEKGIWDHTGCLCPHYFDDSAVERVVKRIEGLHEQDRLLQLELMEESLALRHMTSHRQTQAEPSTQTTSVDFLQEAQAIYDEMVAKVFPEQKHNQRVLSYQHSLRNEIISIAPLNLSLYEGTLGMALFMAALYKMNGKTAVKDHALQLVRPFRESLRHQEFPLPVHRMALGMAQGLGGLIQGLLLMGDYLAMPDLHQDVIFLIEQIKPDFIKQEERADWFNGIAGLLHGLLSAYEKTKDEKALALAIHCGSELVKRRVTKLPHQQHMVRHMEDVTDQKGEPAPVPTGFRDQSGILYPLLRLHAITKEPGLTQLLEEGLHQEATTLRALMERNQAIPTGICNGLGGMALLQLGLCQWGFNEDHQKNALLWPWLEKMARETVSGEDHLCCGNSGIIEWQLETARILGREEWRQLAIESLGNMVCQKRITGTYHILGHQRTYLWNPAFFQGLSGIGYSLLRGLDEDGIKSLYSF